MMSDDPAARVALTRLRLTDFRNHAALTLDFGGRSAVFIGDNGVGKTNILEAISLLAPGRGFRRATLAELARHGGGGGFAVSADLDGGPFGETRIGTGIEPDGHLRQVRINGEPQKGSEGLSDHVRLIWLIPAMDGLFTGSAGERRRFLDRMVLTLDPGHGRRVATFETALTSRNRLLEDRNADPAWLDAIEQQIAETGIAIAAARREAVDCLSRLVARQGHQSPFPPVRLSLEGSIDDALRTGPASDVEDWYRVDLGASRSRDRAAGRTLTGPHRSDLAVRHGVKDMPAALCSTGEQKALLIGLVLAQAALVAELVGQKPLLLLDEVTAHLDEARRHALFDLLDGLGGQTFMTGTDARPFAPLRDSAALLGIAGDDRLFTPDFT
ncbi:DNA replication/repair protein RecF [Oryzibacter oryziterrae]|uniref:DNA replication/repair protein RecF n=1 Tax=Oryzibacter oryziterrae TaxID=2766474 RepID=UPI001F014A9A|nr:DNA replication/repair protein RecF [Oryzibacter oryziterrae]